MADDTDSRTPRRPHGRITFDLCTLNFEGRDIRGIVIDSEPWYCLNDILVAASGTRSALNNLTKYERIRLIQAKFERGKSYVGGNSIWTDDEQGEASWVNEIGALRLCVLGSGLTPERLAEWMLYQAGPFLRAAGLREATALELPVRRTRLALQQKKAGQEPTTLYRLMDESHNLLYVGISMSHMRRLMAHKATKDWWHEVSRIDFENYPDRESAREAERRAIAHEGPKYNIAA